MKKLILSGPAKRFNFEGVLYVANGDDGKSQVVYEVDDAKAQHLLGQFERETGYSYFEEYTGEAKAIKAEAIQETERPKRALKKTPKVNERFKPTERAPRTGTPAADGILEI